MKFVCLVYFEPQAFAALSPNEKAGIGRDSMAYDKELDRSGHYIVEPRRLILLVQRGPCKFAEAKQRLSTDRLPRPRNIWEGSFSSTRRTSMRRSKSRRRFRWPKSAASRLGQ